MVQERQMMRMQNCPIAVWLDLVNSSFGLGRDQSRSRRAVYSKVACPYPFCRGATPMSSIEHHLTERYVLIDDFLTTHPALLQGRQSPHDQPALADAAVLTIALLQGVSGGPVSSQAIGCLSITTAPLSHASALTSNGWQVGRRAPPSSALCCRPR